MFACWEARAARRTGQVAAAATVAPPRWHGRSMGKAAEKCALNQKHDRNHNMTLTKRVTLTLGDTCADNTIRVWRVSNGQVHTRPPIPQLLTTATTIGLNTSSSSLGCFALL